MKNLTVLGIIECHRCGAQSGACLSNARAIEQTQGTAFALVLLLLLLVMIILLIRRLGPSGQ